jgi:hypothetical protein
LEATPREYSVVLLKNNIDDGLEPYLYVLDLNDNMPVEAYIPPNAFQKHSLPSNTVPVMAYEDQDTQTILWYKNDSLFAYFDTESGTPATSMSLFNTNTKSWSSANVQGEGMDLFQYWGSEASVSLPEIGLSFSFGGDPIFPAPEAHHGLVTASMSHSRRYLSVILPLAAGSL